MIQKTKPPTLQKNSSGEIKINTLTPEQIRTLSGTEIEAFAQGLLAQLSVVDGTPSIETPEEIKTSRARSYAMISSLAPQNGLQAMLAAQLSAIHTLQLHCAMAAKHSSQPEQKKTYLNFTTKLANTFVQQANALSKLQGNSQQKVLVEHVNVHAGGQAIVGTVEQAEKDEPDEEK